MQGDLEELIRAPGGAGVLYRRAFDGAQCQAAPQSSRKLLADREEVVQIGVVDGLEVPEQGGRVVDPEFRSRNVKKAQLQVRRADLIASGAFVEGVKILQGGQDREPLFDLEDPAHGGDGDPAVVAGASGRIAGGYVAASTLARAIYFVFVAFGEAIFPAVARELKQ